MRQNTVLGSFIPTFHLSSSIMFSKVTKIEFKPGASGVFSVFLARAQVYFFYFLNVSINGTAWYYWTVLCPVEKSSNSCLVIYQLFQRQIDIER